MAYIGNRFVLLEKNGLSDSGRCILKLHHIEEIVKFYLCSHVHRTIYDFHRIRPVPHNQKWQWSTLQFQRVPTVFAKLQHHTPNLVKCGRRRWQHIKVNQICLQVLSQAWSSLKLTCLPHLYLQHLSSVSEKTYL